MCAIIPRDGGSYSYAGTAYANPHAVTSVGGTTYTYDNNGNVTAIGSLDYAWDWRNRLSSAERSGGGITSYGYDHTGQRVFQANGKCDHLISEPLLQRRLELAHCNDHILAAAGRPESERCSQRSRSSVGARVGSRRSAAPSRE